MEVAYDDKDGNDEVQIIEPLVVDLQEEIVHSAPEEVADICTSDGHFRREDPFMVTIDDVDGKTHVPTLHIPDLTYKGKIQVPEFTFLDGSHISFVSQFPTPPYDEFSVQPLAERVMEKTGLEIIQGRHSGKFNLMLDTPGAAGDENDQCDSGVVSYIADSVVSLDSSFLEQTATGKEIPQPDDDPVDVVKDSSKRKRKYKRRLQFSSDSEDNGKSDDEWKPKKAVRKPRVSNESRPAVFRKVPSTGDGRRKCTRCYNHAGLSVGCRDHVCPYKTCACDNCILILRRSLVYRASMNAIRTRPDTAAYRDLNKKTNSFQEVNERIKGLQPIIVQAMLERYNFRVEKVVEFVETNIQTLEDDPEAVLLWLMREISKMTAKQREERTSSVENVDKQDEVTDEKVDETGDPGSEEEKLEVIEKKPKGGKGGGRGGLGGCGGRRRKSLAKEQQIEAEVEEVQ